ncbi:hypothetical protein KAR91_46335 [Candidatus Pacearchaeota archaeon]|nr:hypothetical protein [Candidatus Pacearchaeota archaeon]
MSGIATAIAGAAVIGAVSQRSSTKKAAASQERGQDLASTLQREAAAQARNDAIPLFQSAQQNALQGFQGALDIFGQTVPQQLQAFQGGNVGAQQALLAGLPQQQAAILGGQLDPNALQAQTLQLPDFSTFQQQLPQFTDINQALGVNQPQQQTNRGGFPIMGIPSNRFAELLAGGNFNTLGASPRRLF